MRGIIGSSLEQFRESMRSPIIDGERFLARTQASFDAGGRMFASWKPGFLYLTPTRILFYQGENQLFALPLASIKGVEVVTARWVSKKTCEQLQLRRETEKGARTVRLRIEALEKWKGLVEQELRIVGSVPADRGPQKKPQEERPEAVNPSSK